MNDFVDLVWGILGIVLAAVLLAFLVMNVDEWRERKRRRRADEPPDEVGAP